MVNAKKPDIQPEGVHGLDLDALNSIPRKTVLVVEDDPDTVLLLKQILRLAGFDVLGAFNGYEAVQKAAEANPDLILLDLMLPDTNGYEVCVQLRKWSRRSRGDGGRDGDARGLCGAGRGGRWPEGAAARHRRAGAGAARRAAKAQARVITRRVACYTAPYRANRRAATEPCVAHPRG